MVASFRRIGEGIAPFEMLSPLPPPRENVTVPSLGCALFAPLTALTMR
jgi:hypothetical protein